MIRFPGNASLPYKLSKPIAALAAAAALAACQSGGGGPSGGAVKDAQQLTTESEAYAGRDVTELVSDAAAMRVAADLYAADCASCHGPKGTGGRSVMNLVDGRFNYGSTAEAIRATIAQGRKSVMPPMANQANLGEVDLGQLVAYVRALPTKAPGAAPTTYEKRGRELFVKHCAVCHGDDAKGNTEKGAPDLTDHYWLNGDSMMNVRLTITSGDKTECPAHADKLTPAQIDLLTAYVLKLHRPAD